MNARRISALVFLPISPGAMSAQSITESKPSGPSIGSLLGDPIHLVWMIVIVSFATAAFVEVVKDLAGYRRHFHRCFIRRWIRLRAAHGIKAGLRGNGLPDDPFYELEKLAGGGETGAAPAFYALPAENVCGQLAAAAEVAVGAPDAYPAAFAVLTNAGGAFSPDEFDQYVSFCRDRKNLQKASSDKPESKEFDDNKREYYGDLRSRFMVQAQRTLDNLQVALAGAWRWRLLAMCIYSSLLFSCWGAYYFRIANFNGTGNALLVLFVAAFGAMLAPFAHDLMRAVRFFRRP
jgi:hypothetical protein